MKLQCEKPQLILTLTLVLLLGLSTPTLAAQAKTKISLWHHWTLEVAVNLIDEILADFEKAYPWIETEQIPNPTGGAVDRMGVLLAAGSAPEVMMVNSTYAYQFMSLGGFLSLDSLVKRENINLAMFNPGDLRGFQVLGKTYALPCMSGSAWTNLMFYNKDLMGNVGLDADKPPKTWSEWQTAARRLHRVSGNGAITQSSHIPRLSTVGAWNGAQYWSEDWRTATLSNPRTVETIEFMSELVGSTHGTIGAHDLFHRGGLSFWEGTSGINFPNNSGFGAAQNVKFDWGATLAPVNEKNPDARPVGIVSSTWAYGIPASISTDKQEAAWLLVQWLTAYEEGGGYFARAQGRPSPVIRFNRHADYRKNNPYWNVVIEALQYEMATPPVAPIAMINNAGLAVLRGQSHPQEALAAADQQLQFALTQYWELIGK